MQAAEDRIVAAVRLKPRKSVAEIIGKSERTLGRWAAAGSGPPITRIGQTVYYEESNLKKWLRSRERAA